MIQAKNIQKHFGTLAVLRGIDLEVAPREIVSIVGASGAGKTTLLQILGTLMQADKGSELSINGQRVTDLSANEQARLRNQEIGFIFQAHQLLPEFTALENVMIPALIGGERNSLVRPRALELLDLLGLSDRADHKPAHLSGGECQRIAVARALINQPSVVLADEPSGSLDSSNKGELHQLFFRLRRELGQTFVIVTHDTDFAQEADRMILLRDGQIERIEYGLSSSRLG